MLRSRLAVALVVTCAVGGPLVCRQAQAQAHEPPPEAMTLFESARQHYRAGEYTAAAEDLENALVIDPAAPTLLFNLGRVYELQGDYARSLSAYRRLLAVTPPEQSEERERTEQAIDRLEGAQEHQAPPPAQESGEVEQGPTFVRERGVADMPFWITFVAGGVVGLTAIGCGVGAVLSHSAADAFVLGRDGTADERTAMYQQSRDLGLAGDILGGLGSAALIAAGLLFILREHTYEQWSASLSIGPSAATLLVGGTF
jgi:tetratricopeptide (TPR) repeat protein